MTNLYRPENIPVWRSGYSQYNTCEGYIRDSRCLLCRNIRFEQLRVGGVYVYDTNYVKKSNSDGCHLCQLIAHLTLRDKDNFDNSRGTPIVLWGAERRSARMDRGYADGVSPIESIMVSRGHRSEVDQALVLFTTADDPAAQFLQRRPATESTGSAEALALAKGWVAECVTKHSRCQKNGHVNDVKRPSRFLDLTLLDDEDTIPLRVIDESKRFQYVALSYCWDGKQDLVLSQEQLEAGLASFTLSHLPLTIRDAIQITLSLGIKYLWVDPLQTGEGGQDFQKQGSLMHQVYGNAFLTFAATASSNVHDGISRKLVHHQQEVTEKHLVNLCIDYDLPTHDLGRAYIVCEPAMYGRSHSREPLSTRGWALQERVLSPRVLMYRPNQISWDCCCSSINSYGPLNYFDGLFSDSPGRWEQYTGTNWLKFTAEDQSLIHLIS